MDTRFRVSESSRGLREIGCLQDFPWHSRTDSQLTSNPMTRVHRNGYKKSTDIAVVIMAFGRFILDSALSRRQCFKWESWCAHPSPFITDHLLYLISHITGLEALHSPGDAMNSGFSIIFNPTCPYFGVRGLYLVL